MAERIELVKIVVTVEYQHPSDEVVREETFEVAGGCGTGIADGFLSIPVMESVEKLVMFSFPLSSIRKIKREEFYGEVK